MKRNLIILILIILAGIGLSIVNEIVDKNRCYELPLNDFYNTPSCQKYVKEFEYEWC